MYHVGMALPTRPKDVPVIRRTLVDRLWKRPIGEFMAHADLNRSRGQRASDHYTPGQDLEAIQYAHSEVRILTEAHQFWVSTDMARLLRAAVETAPTNVTLEAPDLFSRTGFVVFETSFEGLNADYEGVPVRIGAMEWAEATIKGRRSVHMGFYGRTTEMVDYDPNQVDENRVIGDWFFLGASAWPFGDELGDTGIWTHARSTAAASFIEDRKIILSLFSLLSQRIVSNSPYRPDRNDVRQAQRRGEVWKDVNIITLRELTSRGSGEHLRDVEWTHRWLVSGHWRQQWYPSEGRHIAKYIAPHIKGPKDKPLVIKENVYAWRR